MQQRLVRMVPKLAVRPFPRHPDWLRYVDVSPDRLCLDEGTYRSAQGIIGQSATRWPVFIGGLLARVSAQTAVSQVR